MIGEYLLYHPYPHEVVLIDPSYTKLRAEAERAHAIANHRAKVRTAAPLNPKGVLSTLSGQRKSCGAFMTNLGVRSVIGCAWVTVSDRRHVRIVAGRVYPRVNIWGHHLRAGKARNEEFVYPDLLGRIAGLWGHDGAVRDLLRLAAEEPLKTRIGTYAVLADRLDELGADEDASLLRRGEWKKKQTKRPPGPDGIGLCGGVLGEPVAGLVS
jgi:hypothetical protein